MHTVGSVSHATSGHAGQSFRDARIRDMQVLLDTAGRGQAGWPRDVRNTAIEYLHNVPAGTGGWVSVRPGAPDSDAFEPSIERVRATASIDICLAPFDVSHHECADLIRVTRIGDIAAVVGHCADQWLFPSG